MFDRLSKAQETRFWQLNDALAAHGYVIQTTPIVGLEQVWLDDIAEGFKKVESAADYFRKQYGYRGLSANVLKALAIRLPNPSDNIELK